jgi:hypothetical protein
MSQKLNLFVVHTEGEHGKRPPLPAALVTGPLFVVCLVRSPDDEDVTEIAAPILRLRQELVGNCWVLLVIQTTNGCLGLRAYLAALGSQLLSLISAA